MTDASHIALDRTRWRSTIVASAVSMPSMVVDGGNGCNSCPLYELATAFLRLVSVSRQPTY